MNNPTCPKCLGNLTPYIGFKACLSCGFTQRDAVPTPRPVAAKTAPLPSVATKAPTPTPAKSSAKTSQASTLITAKPSSAVQAAAPASPKTGSGAQPGIPGAAVDVVANPPAYAHLPVPPSMYPAPAQALSPTSATTATAAPAATKSAPLLPAAPPPGEASVDPLPASYNIPELKTPAAVTSPTPPKRHRYRRVAIGLVVFVILAVAGTFGYGETTAHRALSAAQARLDNGQYVAAYNTLQPINQSLTFPATKKQLKADLAKADRWAYQQTLLDQAKQLLQAGKYRASLVTLASIDRDFPDYNQVERYQRQANTRIAKIKAADEAAKAAAAKASSEVAAQPAPTPVPAKPVTKPKPKPAPAPAPTPTPQPSAPTPQPTQPQPVVVTPNPEPTQPTETD